MGGWKPRYCRLLTGGLLECYKWDRDKKLVEGTSVDLSSVREMKLLGGVSNSSRMSFGKAPSGKAASTAFQLVGAPCHDSGRCSIPASAPLGCHVAGPRTTVRELDAHDMTSKEKWLMVLGTFVRASTSRERLSKTMSAEL